MLGNNPTENPVPPNVVAVSISIEALPPQVWNIITNSAYAKELGSVFDKNAFIDSEWKLGSEVHFKYEPDKIVSTGTVGKLTEHELIQVDYDFPGMDYVERYTIVQEGSTSKLSIYAGVYGEDFEAQKVVWSNWLSAVKKICEK